MLYDSSRSAQVFQLNLPFVWPVCLVCHNQECQLRLWARWERLHQMIALLFINSNCPMRAHHIPFSLPPVFSPLLPLQWALVPLLVSRNLLPPLYTSRMTYTRSLVTSHKKLTPALRTNMTSAPVVTLRNWTMPFETRKSRCNAIRWPRNVQMPTPPTTMSLIACRRTLSERMLKKIASLDRWRCYVQL